MNAITLGLQLARIRLEAGLTQTQLAKLMGTTQPAISKIESGRTFPTIPLLDRFAEATGKPVNLVLGGDDRTEVPPSVRAKRAQIALAGFQFNPWDRFPSSAEAKSLIADGLTPERFQSQETAGRGVAK